jgi:hypothetical protein
VHEGGEQEIPRFELDECVQIVGVDVVLTSETLRPNSWRTGLGRKKAGARGWWMRDAVIGT